MSYIPGLPILGNNEAGTATPAHLNSPINAIELFVSPNSGVVRHTFYPGRVPPFPCLARNPSFQNVIIKRANQTFLFIEQRMTGHFAQILNTLIAECSNELGLNIFIKNNFTLESSRASLKHFLDQLRIHVHIHSLFLSTDPEIDHCYQFITRRINNLDTSLGPLSNVKLNELRKERDFLVGSLQTQLLVTADLKIFSNSACFFSELPPHKKLIVPRVMCHEFTSRYYKTVVQPAMCIRNRDGNVKSPWTISSSFKRNRLDEESWDEY